MAHAPYEVMLASAVATLFVVVGLASIHLGAGAFYATQREENPAKIAASQGASATFLMSVAYLMVTAGLLVFPIARFLETTPPPHAERLLVNAVVACRRHLAGGGRDRSWYRHSIAQERFLINASIESLMTQAKPEVLVMATNHNAVKAMLCIVVMVCGWMVVAAQGATHSDH